MFSLTSGNWESCVSIHDKEKKKKAKENASKGFFLGRKYEVNQEKIILVCELIIDWVFTNLLEMKLISQLNEALMKIEWVKLALWKFLLKDNNRDLKGHALRRKLIIKLTTYICKFSNQLILGQLIFIILKIIFLFLFIENWPFLNGINPNWMPIRRLFKDMFGSVKYQGKKKMQKKIVF